MIKNVLHLLLLLLLLMISNYLIISQIVLIISLFNPEYKGKHNIRLDTSSDMGHDWSFGIYGRVFNEG